MPFPPAVMPSRDPPSPAARDATARALLISLPLLALVPKLWLIRHSLDAGSLSVFDTGFGFGNYIRSLAEEHAFRSCSLLPFDPCKPGICVRATRMPGLPVLLAMLSWVVGTGTAAVAAAKCTLLAILSTVFLAALSRDVRITIWGVLILYAMYLGPQALKHGAALVYEEGVLVDLSLCLAVALAYAMRPELSTSQTRRASMIMAAAGIAVVMYLTKTTALLTLAVVIGLVLTSGDLQMRGKLACIILVAVPVGAWGIHNLKTSGVFSISSSWNGENLVRGYDSGALAIYPQISLDRLFDSSAAVLDNGSRVALGDYSHRQCFNDEWSWSSAYSRMASQWLAAHPLQALEFLARKTWVTLIEVRHTPTYGSATDKGAEISPLVSASMITWMIAARSVFFWLVLRIVLDLIAGRNRRYAWALALLAGACMPYMVVFAYQRHTIPILVLAGSLLVFLYFVAPRNPAPAAA